ncbi:MAG: hypothetical protein ACLP5H_26465 [Desulfomonilaceae bacterium]
MAPTIGITRQAPRSVSFAAVAVITCSIFLTACASGILGSKDSKEKIQGDAASTSPSRLVRPAMSGDRSASSLDPQNSSETPGAASEKSSNTFAAPAKGSKAEKPATERVSSLQNDLERETPGSVDDKERSGQSSSEGPKGGVPIRTAIEDVRRDLPASGKSGADASPKDDLPFKKHDHVKYMQRIKNKAIDRVNKESEASYARLCRDSTTDEWSLWIYRVEGKAYRFVTYTWDEVDEKWEESFKSNKQPISGLQHHLKFSTDGKDCKVLKDKRH